MFTFNNSELILALRERGAHISNQNFDEVTESDKKVCELFQEFENFTVPTSAFVTFESVDHKILALEYDKEGTILGEKMRYQDASEPTDIIWENRHFTKLDYIKRRLIAIVIIALVLSFSFIAMFWISKYSAKITSVFPSVDC